MVYRAWYAPISLVLAICTFVIIVGHQKLLGQQQGSPTVSWSSRAIQVTLAPGTSHLRFPTVSIDASEDVTIEVVPALATFVTVHPTQILKPTARHGYELTLTFHVPIGTPVGSYEGTLHVRSRQRTISQPLSISVTVVPTLSAEAALRSVADELESGDIKAALQTFSPYPLNTTTLMALSPEKRSRLAAGFRGARLLEIDGKSRFFAISGVVDGIPDRELMMTQQDSGTWLIVSW